MKYSVLMSVYEKENPKWLAESIESILQQTVQPAEFVIVCDGKLTDALDRVLQKYQLEQPGIFRVFRLPENQGLGAALNYGLKQCRYDYVARMDSDDISFPKRCEKQLAVMEEKQLDLAGAIVLEFEGDIKNVTNQRITPRTQEEIIAFSKKRNPFNHPVVMFRKEAVLAAGGYQPFPYFEDYFLWVRILEQGAKCYNIMEPLLFMRAGEGMMKRRGGISYVKCIWRFKWELHRRGYTTWLQFLQSTLPHVIVSLIPNGLRKWIYQKLLRKGT